MNQTKEIEFIKPGETIFCIDESTYAEHITKRKEYQIAELGTGTKEGKVRIKGDSGKLIWITELCFSKSNQPLISQIVVDDKITNPFQDSIEVTIKFENDTKGWFRVTTPDYITDMLKSNQMYYDQSSIVVVEITKEIIEDIVRKLDKSNELIDLLIPCK